MILQSWPTHKSAIPSELVAFFDHRDELTVLDGIILRGDQVVIPRSLQSSMKQRVHAGHMGINSCLRRARELIYWPGMSRDIRQYVQACHVCATYPDRQPPETLRRHEVPERPWQKVASDIFTFCDRNYLVTVDCFSNFIEVDYLPDTQSKTVITELKVQFARYGIPDILISDGGPQYTSSEFKSFSKHWSFDHNVTSTGNSKANGAAEAAVKIVKKMRKCKLQHEDPYLGLLSIRNTVNEGWHSSRNGITRYSDKKQKAGYYWMKGFLIRHPVVTIKTPEGLSASMASGMNQAVIEKWLIDCEALLTKLNIIKCTITHLES